MLVSDCFERYDFSRAVQVLYFCHPERASGIPAKRHFCAAWGVLQSARDLFFELRKRLSPVAPEFVLKGHGFSRAD